MKILIDNGHGIATPGKRSPDGRLREYRWARECADLLTEALIAKGYSAERIVTEESDVPLSVRCRRVNAVCRQLGASNVILVSIHNNAAGADGKWHSARGFSAHVGLNASKSSKRLASCLWTAMIEKGLQGNRSVPKERYIAQNLAICRDTLCPAVLTENLFQDNREDVEYLLSPSGIDTIANTLAEGIERYLRE